MADDSTLPVQDTTDDSQDQFDHGDTITALINALQKSTPVTKSPYQNVQPQQPPVQPQPIPRTPNIQPQQQAPQQWSNPQVQQQQPQQQQPQQPVDYSVGINDDENKPKNVWQQVYASLIKNNPKASSKQILQTMMEYKQSGAFDAIAKNAVSKSIEQQVYDDAIKSGKSPFDAAQDAVKATTKMAANSGTGKTVDEQLYAAMIKEGKTPAEAAAAIQKLRGVSVEDVGAKEKAKQEADLAVKQQGMAPKQAQAAQDTIENINTLDDHITEALKQINSGTAGVFGSMVKGIYQPAADLENTLGSIGSSLGFQQLQEMRKNSPTGAALGRVTNYEMQMLQSTVASLKQNQSPEQLKANLQIVKKVTDKIKAALEEDSKNGVSNSGSSSSTPAFSGKTVNFSDLPE